MSEMAILGSTLAAVIVVLFFIQEREATKRALELKMFQMENTRLIQQMARDTAIRHEENMTFFKGLGYSVGRVVHKLDAGDNAPQ